MTHDAFHLKELVWFRGWIPTYWLLADTGEGLKARCTHASDLPADHRENGKPRLWEEPVTDEMLAKIEKAVPGSLAARMGFEYLLCQDQPGSAVLNRPLNFQVTRSPADAGTTT